MKISNYIALRYLKPKRSNTILSFVSSFSIIGILLGVATLIVVINVMMGFEDNLKNKILGVNAHIIVNRIDGEPLEHWELFEKLLGNVDGVVGVAPYLINQVLLTSKTNVSGVVVKGIIPEKEINVTSVKKFLKDGDLPAKYTEGSAPDVLLGKELANQLGVVTGDEVVMISPFGKKGPLGFTPRMKHFNVSGIFDAGMYDYNSTFALISLNTAQEFFQTGDIVGGFSIKVIDFDKANIIASKIQTQLGFPYFARDWLSMNKSLFSALKLEKIAMFVILTLIIVVASFNVLSLITMTVKDKKRDIAILRAMGMSENTVKKIFIKQGLMIGIFGTVIGNVLAYVICFILKNYKIISLPEDIYFLDSIPIKITPDVFILVTIAAILITLLSCIYPSIQATREDPVEALRNE